MRVKEPSQLEKARAVRYMRHVENCHKCGINHDCLVAMGHNRRWASSYYKEALGACKHLQEGECWADRCKGGRKAALDRTAAEGVY